MTADDGPEHSSILSLTSTGELAARTGSPDAKNASKFLSRKLSRVNVGFAIRRCTDSRTRVALLQSGDLERLSEWRFNKCLSGDERADACLLLLLAGGRGGKSDDGERALLALRRSTSAELDFFLRSTLVSSPCEFGARIALSASLFSLECRFRQDDCDENE